MAKSFRGSRPRTRQRAPGLFSRFRSFVEQGFPYIRQNVSILRDEILAADGKISRVQPFNGLEYGLFRNRVERLSNGILDSQTEFAMEFRKNQVMELRKTVSPFRSSRLAQLAQMDLETFINQLWGEKLARDILKVHLANVHDSGSGADLTRLAKRMLRGVYPVAHAFVRTDLFLNWRKERSGALRRDAADDVYHLVNASYCDIYGTSDSDQNEYAAIVLPDVKFSYYDRETLLADWLSSLSQN